PERLFLSWPCSIFGPVVLVHLVAQHKGLVLHPIVGLLAHHVVEHIVGRAGHIHPQGVGPVPHGVRHSKYTTAVQHNVPTFALGGASHFGGSCFYGPNKLRQFVNGEGFEFDVPVVRFLVWFRIGGFLFSTGGH